MQGLTKLGGTKTPKSVRPTTTSGRFAARYGHTLAGITMPAMVAALATAVLYGDRTAKADPEFALIERVNMIRAAEQKRTADAEMQTSAVEHAVRHGEEVPR